MWSVFLSKIEIKLKPVLFQTWFQDTKLIDLNNEYDQSISESNDFSMDDGEGTDVSNDIE